MKRVFSLFLVFLIVSLVLTINPTKASPDGWVSPSGFEDPDSKWSDEVNAYDEDTASYTAHAAIPANTWGSYLVLTIDEITSDVLRLWNSYSGFFSPAHTQVDIYNGSWVNIYDGAFKVGAQFFDYPYSETKLTAMRVRYKSSLYFSSTPYVNEVDFWEVEGVPPTEYNFYGTVNSQISVTSERSWIFGRYSSINPVASIDSQKSVSFSLFAAISQAFSTSSLFSYFQTRNFFGSITQLFSATSRRTWIFDVQGLIQQVFGIQSYTSLPTTTLYMILGLISLALSCIATPLSIKKKKSAFIFILSVTGLVFAVIAIALSNFATAALAFVLAIPALALSLIKQEKQA